MKNEHPRWHNRATTLLIVVAMLLPMMSGCGSSELTSGLSEAEAQEVVAVLQQYGLDAKKVKVGEDKDATWLVQVPAAELNSSNQILRKYELPREKPRGLGEVFSQAGLIPTATEEKAMYLTALQGEIVHTLQTIDGVVAARVHIVMPEKNPLAENPTEKASASVLLKYRGDHMPLTQEEIKQIVSHAVDGLDPALVAVVMKPVLLDRIKLAQMAKPTIGNIVKGENSTVVVFLLAALCLVLAIVLVVMVLRLQKEKQKVQLIRQQAGR